MSLYLTPKEEGMAQKEPLPSAVVGCGQLRTRLSVSSWETLWELSVFTCCSFFCVSKMSLSTWSALACMREMSRASSWVAPLVGLSGAQDSNYERSSVPAMEDPVPDPHPSLLQGRVCGLSSERLGLRWRMRVLSPVEGFHSESVGLCVATSGTPTPAQRLPASWGGGRWPREKGNYLRQPVRLQER